jgi:hypothetical protein
MSADRFHQLSPPAAGLEPEFRALQEILAIAAARGEQVFFLGPAGIVEIRELARPGQEFLGRN